MLFTKRRYTITMHDGLRVPSEILITFSPRNSYERERESRSTLTSVLRQMKQHPVVIIQQLLFLHLR